MVNQVASPTKPVVKEPVLEEPAVKEQVVDEETKSQV
jgi:hypothetical protein